MIQDDSGQALEGAGASAEYSVPSFQGHPTQAPRLPINLGIPRSEDIRQIPETFPSRTHAKTSGHKWSKPSAMKGKLLFFYARFCDSKLLKLG